MLNGKSILVVDDEPDLREILCDEFSLIGAEVAGAPNGKEALKQVHARPFDVVVSDLRMPGGDGVSLARALKSEANSPLVVLMTGFADLTAEEAFEIGAEGFLTKPFHLESIRDNLARLLTPPRERWSMTAQKPAVTLTLDDSVYEGRELSTYLGRGGFFIPGERLQVRVGQEIGFKIGSKIEGTGFVRWLRLGSSNGRGPGVGIEFQSLTAESLERVLQKLAEHQTQAYLPRGF